MMRNLHQPIVLQAP
uniref:Uncharacterized protein n=1 Tax=Anguilla anguilla TaxID=7936 RepID=A0A0E9RWT6_ANGAN